MIRAKRPVGFFDPTNTDWPDKAELRLEMPGVLAAVHGEDTARTLIAERVREHERAAHAESKQEGIPFKGARRCTVPVRS